MNTDDDGVVRETIDEDVREIMNDLAKLIDRSFNEEGKPRVYGFALLIFKFGRTDDRMNYISNAQREDMLTAMKEFIAKHEGRAPAGPKGVQ